MDQLENASLVLGDSQTSSSGITDLQIRLDEQIQNDPCINSAFDLGENASSQAEIAYNQRKQNLNMLPVLSPINPNDFIIPMLSPEEREIRQRQIQEEMRQIDLQIQSILQNTCNNPVGISPGFNCGCPMQPNVCNFATSGNLVENTLPIPINNLQNMFINICRERVQNTSRSARRLSRRIVRHQMQQPDYLYQNPVYKCCFCNNLYRTEWNLQEHFVRSHSVLLRND